MLRYILRDRLSVRYVTRGFDVSMLLLFFCLLFSNRIISVMDGSLPKKPCKTCKNRFHAGCLYKVCLFFFFFVKACYNLFRSGSTRVIPRVVLYVVLMSCEYRIMCSLGTRDDPKELSLVYK